MNLKAIQLSGFKSFADKTTIRFDEGVTCIVGPNGCGKSNISDAVRWVLGEISAKNLRGSNMADVVFGGTDLRKPQKSCEVTLVFDNENRIFDIDAPEVSMTRKFVKTSDTGGDSKYFINGQNARLKDLVKLFHGIGLGKEGYSIIGQGKVEQIMNAKPEDRRLVFEEATGVMTFKARKTEIENKIERSKNDLFIYSQRIDETERRLGPLEKQAKAAREKAEYTADLKYNEVNTYVYKYDHAESEKGKYRDQVSTYSDKIIALNTKLEILANTYEDNRKKIANADEALVDLNDKRVELSVGNERKAGEMNLVRERISTYRSQINAAKEFLEGGKRRIGEIANEIAENQIKNKTAEKRLADIENETEVLRSTVNSLSGKIALFEKLSDESRQSQLSKADELNEFKKNQGTLEARKEATREKIDELNQSLSKSKSRKEDLENDLKTVRADLKKLRSFTSGGTEKIEEKTEEIRDMQLTINNFNQELFNAGGTLASLKENLEMYISLKNRFEGYKDSVRRLLSVAKTNPDVKSRLNGAIADIIRTDQKYEVAIETALGGAMQNVVTPTSDDAKYLIEYLRRTNGGVVTFYPVSSMRPHPDGREIQRAVGERGAVGLADELVKFDDVYFNVVSNLLGNTLICDNIGNANAIAKKYGNTFKIVTLEGDIILTSGAMTGGATKHAGSSLLSGERKIEECRENIAKKEKYIEKLNKAIAESEREKEKAEAEVEKLRLQYQDANNEQVALTQRENVLCTQIGELEGDIEIFAATLDDFKNKLKALTAEEQNALKDERELLKAGKGAEEAFATQRTQIEQYRVEFDEKSKSLHALELERATLEKQREQSTTDEERLAEEKNDLAKRILATETEKDNYENELIAMEEQAKEKELSEEEKAAVKEIEDQIAKITAQKDALNLKQTEIDEERAVLSEDRDKQSDKRYKAEIEITKIDTGLENMRQHIEEDYSMDYEGCLALKAENFNVDDAQNLISALKRKITMLGEVNECAVQEFEDEQKYYTEMITQRDDLQKAIDDLTTALNEIRGEMLRMFDEGFKSINENFQVTFKQLFGGGHAELQMDYVEGEDPLDAGVEIIACPPGKKLSKISLLSGGERALTAIAILFAIIRTKPMPFCILDEIEAALDDANVDRFASYLKRFVQETQFIVITHRKPTMNQADALFGVTMQEKGVSKIVSVKLGDVVSLGNGTVE